MNIASNKGIKGLSSGSAKKLLERDGYNELLSAKPKSLPEIVIDVVKEPMVLILISCGILYLFLGDVGEGIALAIGVVMVVGITFYQERKAERTLEGLRVLSSPRAIVIRDGEEKRVAGRELVVGDIIIVSEGDRVPADAVLIESLNLSVDESILTGESVAVLKEPGPGGVPLNTEDTSCCLFSGCMVVQGRGIAKVSATGVNTRLGAIGTSVKKVLAEPTPLQKEMRKLVRLLAIWGVALCVLLAIVYYFSRGGIIPALLSGLSLAMAMLPEEFPVILTIFMALGAWRIAKSNVLTRDPSSIETLGAATVLCVDKTGTITQNSMEVEMLFVNDRFEEVHRGAELSQMARELVGQGVWASQQFPFDPMEKALLELGQSSAMAPVRHDGMVREYAISSALLAMTRVYQESDGSYIVAAKGAPEAIFEMCPSIKEKEMLKQRTEVMASKGLRVIGIARAHFSGHSLPESQREFAFQFCGLIGFSDPIRPEVPNAVQQCYSAGIRVIMITGDLPITAKSIARKIGLNNPEKVLTGEELQQMSDSELNERIGDVNIFARIRPEQKLRLVSALKLKREIVAMTGDGVNDAPALKAAHIGISMGEKGTDVAREASSLVLLDDNFASIVAAIRGGRRIFDNLQKAFGYVTAIHVPIAGLALIPVFTGLPIILWPVHIAFHELVIDPVSSIVFESETEEENVMKRPPRAKEDLFNRRRLIHSLAQGLSATGAILAVYLFLLNQGVQETVMRSVCFTTLVGLNLCMVLVDLSISKSIFKTILRPTKSVKVVLGIVCLFVICILTIPFFQRIFQFELFGLKYLALILATCLLGLVWFDLLKRRLLAKPAA
jgi:P-type Ca2+ transporter type 2C